MHLKWSRTKSEQNEEIVCQHTSVTMAIFYSFRRGSGLVYRACYREHLFTVIMENNLHVVT